MKRSPVRRGEDGTAAVLTESQVLDIVAALDAGEANFSIAARYGVAASTISAIATGRTWSHLTGRTP